jgi:hypothetical protein
MSIDLVPDHGMWLVFAADLPDGVLDRERAYKLKPVHRTTDGFYVGIWDPGTNGREGFIVQGADFTATGQVKIVQHPRIVLVDVEGNDVLHPTVLPDGRLESVRVTFALDEVRDLAAADTDDLPPGRHPDNGRANPIRRPARQRRE